MPTGRYVRDEALLCGAPLRGQPGRTCGIYKIRHQSGCRIHGGDFIEGRVLELMEQFGGKLDTHPADALLDLVQHKAAEVHYWRARVSELESVVGARALGGMQETEETDGTLGSTSKSQVVIHIWYKMLRDCEKDLAIYCRAALQSGVEERHVRVAESVGLRMVGAIETVLAAIGITPAQAAIAGKVVPDVLRSLGAPEEARIV